MANQSNEDLDRRISELERWKSAMMEAWIEVSRMVEQLDYERLVAAEDERQKELRDKIRLDEEFEEELNHDR